MFRSKIGGMPSVICDRCVRDCYHELIEPRQQSDAAGSYYEAIADIGSRVKSGEIAMPTDGYFASSTNGVAE